MRVSVFRMYPHKDQDIFVCEICEAIMVTEARRGEAAIQDHLEARR